MLQQGQAQNVHLHPKTFCTLQALQEVVEEQQVVVVTPQVAVRVGPITLAFPGYALLLRFAGRNGGMSYTSSVDTGDAVTVADSCMGACGWFDNSKT